MLDPTLAARFTANGAEWLTECDRTGAVLDAEPHPWATVADRRRVADVFGDLADLKSPFLTGHSRTVAALAGGAADHLGLDSATVADLEIAGDLHERVDESSSIWDKPGALTTGEWEVVRLHGYPSDELMTLARQGRLDPDAVRAVLAAAGLRVPVLRGPLPARVSSRGQSRRAPPSTTSSTSTSRSASLVGAAATLFAVENGLGRYG